MPVINLELKYLVCKYKITFSNSPIVLEQGNVFTTNSEHDGYYKINEYKNEIWVHKDEFHEISYFIIEDVWNKIKNLLNIT
jgi:hypothetical protein